MFTMVSKWDYIAHFHRFIDYYASPDYVEAKASIYFSSVGYPTEAFLKRFLNLRDILLKHGASPDGYIQKCHI
jgi:hypothetical protein